MNELDVYEKRLKKIMINDKNINPNKMEKLLKSEIINILRNYFEISSDNLIVEIAIDSNGYYNILINGISRNIKMASLLS